ncbi:non-ribosomal peptide synthase/polyketide synthase [Burkholderia plantarii]|uniref:non-ribosomal peptide synthase/polyketide synthase n=1 Tax=Burkholderia plantarii TaxID=41899 RepID=UPI0018DD396E|nr:non-ribosomal peptide synthetase [Burkholderia plantarii]MBI0329292.1 non-ribosomal peptide synthase/polyketide synthase [Burkholderia plantarii]
MNKNVPDKIYYRLTSSQREIWFDQEVHGDAPVYNIGGYVKIAGKVDPARMERAIQLLIDKHDALRIVLSPVPDEDGVPMQEIEREMPFTLPCTDLSALADPDAAARRRVDRQLETPFVLQGGRLFRFELLKLGEANFQLVLVHHHLIIDGWAIGLMLDSLGAIYGELEAGQAPALSAPSYVKFIEQDRQYRESPKFDQHRAYWLDKFSDVPEPLFAPRFQATARGGVVPSRNHRFSLPRAYYERLVALAQACEATPFHVILAVLYVYFARTAGREDLTVGLPILNRANAELKATLGMFAGVSAVRLRFGHELSFRELLAALGSLLKQDYRYQRFPVSELNRELGLWRVQRSQVFDISLSYERNDHDLRFGEAVASAVKSSNNHEQTPLAVYLRENRFDDQVWVHFIYNQAYFEQDEIEALEQRFRHLLDQVLAEVARPLNRLAVVTPEERARIASWGAADAGLPRDRAEDSTIHARFEAQVERAPDAIAVVHEGERLTYGELNARANRLAHYLIARGVRPDDRVAICVERGLALVVGVLGVLKAGAGYVPMDPAYPAARLSHMLGDSAPAALLAQASSRAAPGAHAVDTIDLDDAALSAMPADNPRLPELGSHHLAYVIYTSGSTGQPKGVMIEHRNVPRLFSATAPWFGFGAQDVWTLFHSFAFDFSVWEIWGALLHGGRLVVVPTLVGRSPQAFYRLLCDEGVTVLNQTPSAFQQLIAAQGECALAHRLRQVVFGGEALEPGMLQPWFARERNAGTQLVNMYGITETTVHVTYRALQADDARRTGRSPIGVPIPDLRLYVLDRHGEPVPVGVAGEMYVGGAGVARGYLNRAALTAERFVRDPFDGAPDARMYRTGDLARWLADGTLDYLGRNDDQVKIRGFRIELGEIEARLGGVAGVQAAAVLAREDVSGLSNDKRLVGYYTGEPQQAEVLRAALQASLPEYMVPAAFVHLDALPLTANGKLDRRALPAPEADAFASRAYEAPRNEAEHTLARIWQELLGVERVGRSDHFFELGGHSLLAVKLIERMRQAGLSADVRVLFGQPTLAALASAAVARSRSVEVVVPANRIPAGCAYVTPELLPLVSLTQAQIDRIAASVPGGMRNVQDIYPLAPLQEGILYHHLSAAQGDPYVLQALFSLPDRERVAAFVSALQRVIDRHDILRTGVMWEGLDEPVQVVWREAALPVEEVELDAARGDVATQLRAQFDFRTRRLDITRAPMMRIVHAHDPVHQRHVALLLFHHLIDDATSLRYMGIEVDAHLRGQAEALPAPVPYRNYVVQTRLGVDLAAQERFFREMLHDVDEPTLPFGLVDVLSSDAELEEARRTVAPALSRRIRAQARRLGVSAASLHHLAWAQVVGRLSGREDVVFGTVLLGRMQGGAGAERSLGMFINTLPLRAEVGAIGARAAVARMHERLSALLAHEHASLSLAQRCSGVAAPAPLFSALLNYRHDAVQAGETQPGADAWAEVTVLGGEERSNYPLMLSVDDRGDAFGLAVQAVAAIGAARIGGYMEAALAALVEALEQRPDAPMHGLTILPDDERARLLTALNATRADAPREPTVHARFEAQARRTPDAVAVVFGEARLSYRELDERAERLARLLRQRGARRDARVAICVGRSLEMVVGLLGILKSGAAYVPLDPTYPAERLAYMLTDSTPLAVLVHADTAGVAGSTGTPEIDIDGAIDGTTPEPDAPAGEADADASSLAYVIYTSGSTGQPKGVAMPHRALVNLLHWQATSGRQQGHRGGRTLQFAALGFDVAFQETFSTLCEGATLELIPEALRFDFERLFAHIVARRIERLYLPYVALQSLAETVIGRGLDLSDCMLREVITAGEQLRVTDEIRQLFRRLGARLHNHYGPSETHVTIAFALPEDVEAWATLPPIGRPIANTQVYLLDAHGQPVPHGVAAEIHIGGAQVARGYLNRTGLTAERFVRDPFGDDPHACLYRTGDLGRWRADGSLDYLGRNDHQVKVRGFRVELGEIEARLEALDGVKDAVVVARGDAAGGRRLVAYYTGAAQPPEALHAALLAVLPDYMVPGLYVPLAALPLTPNGKLDRRALPEPGADAVVSRRYEAPVGDTERTLARIWQELLGVERVGRHDHFFELGGHSLLAMKLIERMRQAGLSADIRVLFGQPALSALAAAVGTHREVAAPANRIPAGCERITPELLPLVALTQAQIDAAVAGVPGGMRNVQDIYPLAPLQEGILYHHLSSAEGDPYLLQALFSLPDRERVAAFVAALQRVIDRHDILRTRVVWEGLDEPAQVVCRAAPLVVEEVFAEAAQGDVARQMNVQFDPRHYRLDVRQAPLLRVAYAHDAAHDRWVLALLFHHMALDHTALEVMQQEMLAYLEGDEGRLQAAQSYRNYVAQTRLGTSREQHEAFFREMLHDVDEPTLPFGLVDVQGDGRGIEEARLDVDLALARRVRAQARQLGVSAASLYHLAWAQVLGKVSGREDVVFGTVLLGRMQGGAGADRALGMFINTLPLRVAVGGQGVRAGVKATHERLSALLAHEHASLVLAQRCSGVAAPAPLFSALLNYRHSAEPSSDGGAHPAWAGVEILHVEERTNYPLTLSVDDLGDGFGLTVQVVAGIGARRVGGYVAMALAQLVEALEQRPDAPLHGLAIVPPEERTQLLDTFNATRVAYPRGQTIHALFEAQAARTPHAPAVVHDGRQLTYAELNAQANRLAHHLIAQGIRPDGRVAICAERSLEMVVGLLAILKSGAGYVPLDPGYPPERLAYLLADSAPQAVLAQAATRALLAASSVPVIGLDAPAWHGEADHDPVVDGLGARRLAYVIYTSGSTGQPKGVMNEHRAVVNRLLWMQDAYALQPGEAVLQKTSFSFDVSVWEFFWTLSTGATLVMAKPGGQREPAYLKALIQQHGVTTLHFVPSMLEAFLADGDAGRCTSLTRVVCSGEALPAALVRRFKAQLATARLHNLYGPTEAAVDVTAWTCDEDRASTPIGRPIANTRIYVLDARGQPVPLGAVGEIHIGGVQVARGYLNRAALTAERFVRDPFDGAPDARMYRTGDLARWLADGTLDYLGRNDDQVKIRGFRIELGEIEARLGGVAGVQAAAVLAREDVSGLSNDKRLVGYYTGEVQEAEALRAALQASLPEYMVPAAFVHLDALPLTANGKLDRRALPAPEADAFASRAYEAPRNEAEHTLARIWQELLGVERVGRSDHFFELGGHSLLAVKLIERMRQAGLSADVRVLFGQPTLAALASAAVAQSRSVEVVVPANRIPAGCAYVTPELLPLVSLTQAQIDRIAASVPGGMRNVQDIYPLAPLQEGILYHHLSAVQGDPYVLQALFSLPDRERVAAFVSALQRVIDRHDILRTGVMWEGLDEPVQVVWREAALPVEEIELDAARGDVATQLRAQFDPRHYRLDVRQAPLLRVAYAHDAAHDRWVLALLFHHMALDHTALEVMQQEMLAYLEGDEGRLQAAQPYRNYVAQTRLGTSREQHEAFFREMLHDVDEPTLPFGLVDVQGDGRGIEEARLDVDLALARRVRAQARQLGVSAASLYHLAWAQVLGKVSGREDVVFGTVLLGRMQGGAGADRALGMFINTLPLRVAVGGQGVRAGVKATHERLSALLAHEHASLVLAQRCSGVAAPAPLFSALLNYRHGTAGAEAATQAIADGIEVLGGEERTNYPLMMSVDDLGDGFMLTAQVAEGIGAKRICAYLQTALEGLADALARQPERPLRTIAILPPQERTHLLRTLNATRADYPREQTIHALFEAQVARTPHAPAVLHDGRQLTYAELNAHANRLAHRLIAHGVRPDDRVAICAERSLEMVAGLLAILKSGAAYVPLDPAYPAQRLHYMLADSAPVAVLAQAATRAVLGAAPRVPLIELPDSLLAEAVEANDALIGNPVVPGLNARHLAYVIYTSGSTGQPKGVMIEHRNAVNFLCWAHRAFEAQEQARTLFSTSLNFDLAVYECFAPLTRGACIEVVSSVLALRERASDAGLVNTVPSALAALLDSGALGATVRTVNVAGESLRRELVEALFARTGVQRLCNLYGPSETTTYSTWVSMPREQGFAAHIGRPVSNTQIYLLDAHGELVPPGVAGEIHIGGDGVARGYLNRAGLTAERFVTDPFSDDPRARLYRTGDLGRWRADGNLEYLGRNDHQVKIRGFRIEPGEIEARLAALPGVKAAAVLAREDVPGEKRLVAYCAGEMRDVEALRAALRETLPDHMVPGAFVFLDALPLTPNGKLDRHALPAPDADASGSHAYEAPANDTERALARIWQALIGVERVGRHDHFFELGGHSLLAIRLISQVREQLGVELPLAELFTHPSLSALAGALARASRSSLPPVAPLSREPGVALPLSFAQQRLWFLAQMAGGSEAYHIVGGLRLHGALDEAALRRALDAIVARHEALRTTFVAEAGQARPRIAAACTGFALRTPDLSALPSASERETALARLADDEARAPFDLAAGPLVRGQLVRLGADRHALLVTMHHIVSDGWSMGVFTRELAALYRGCRDAGPASTLPALPPLPVQYADYAAWQRRLVDDAMLRRQGAWWRDALLGAPALLSLPTDRPRPAVQDYAGAAVPVVLDRTLTAGLKALAQRHGATPFMVLLAGWATVLGRLAGQDEVVIGAPVANRRRAEVQELIGLFVNTLALRVDLSGDVSADALLQRIKARVLDAQAHQDLPFEQVIEALRPARSLAYSPVFQALLAWRNVDASGLALEGLALEPLTATHRSAKFDVSLALDERDGRIEGELEYASALFERATIERHAGYLVSVLRAMVAEPAQPVLHAPMLGAPERELLLDGWNRTRAPYPAHQRVQRLFEAQARRTPDAVAVIDGETALGYAELDARADRLAQRLVAAGVRPGARVVTVLERGAALVAAQLAILKAGAAYVPIDPQAPAARQAWVMRDCGAPLALVTRVSAGLPDEIAAHALCVDDDDPDIAAATGGIDLPDDGDAVAYVMYTSGSTGTPKGVLVPHRGINRLILNNGYASFGADDRVAWVGNPAFDISTLEVWAPLLHGGCLVVVPHASVLAPQQLRALLLARRITVLHLTSGLFSQIAGPLGEVLGGLRLLLVGGDAVDPAVVARVLAHHAPRHLLHCYGPTENTTFSTTCEITAADARLPRLPIGRPVANTRVYLLDAHGQPVPLGAAGELYVGGDGVALGYLDRPDLSAERFLADPFDATPGARMYRTGDLARYLPDGRLEFLGRNDQQVKIRGFRVEPGEIEAKLAQYPGVRDAAVIARQDAPGPAGEKRLVAYVVPRDGAELPAAALREHLAAALADYMVPGAFVTLAALPLTPNGKLDRRALPAPDADAYASRPYEAPRGETEATLARLWAEVLGVERVGRHDHFFELGGHSLLALGLIARMREAGLDADVRVLFGQPTLAALAAALDATPDAALGAGAPVAVPENRIAADCTRLTPELLPLAPRLTQAGIDRIVASVPGGLANVQDIYPLAPLQEGILYHHLAAGEHDPYVLRALFAVDGRARADAFAAALQGVIDRHDILRTAIVWADLDEPMQVVWRRAPMPVETIDPDPAGGEVAEQLRARHARLDLAQAPLMRMVLAHDAAHGRWVAMLAFHHMVLDHAALEIVEHEIQAHFDGLADRLPVPVPYRNHVAQATLGVSREAHEAFFREMLHDVDEPTLPFGLVDVNQQGAAIEEARLELDAALSRRLRVQARALGVSAASLHHLAWAQVLGRSADREDVVFGTVLLGRLQGGAGAERALGMFINTLPLRVAVGDQPARAAVQATHARLTALLGHEHAPLALAQRCSGVAAPAPLFSALLNYRHSAPVPADGAAPWDGITALDSRERTNYPLSLSVDDLGEGFALSAQTVASVGAARLCELMRCALESLAQALDAAPDTPVRDLEVLSPAARRQLLVDFNATAAAFESDATAHALFEAQARRAPDALALVQGERSLSYGELNRQANRLAHHLRERGVRPADRVAICVERGVEMIVGVLAVWKAGAAYVPLDPAYPRERLAYMLEDSAPAAVLVQAATAGRLEAGEARRIRLDQPEAWREASPLDPLPADADIDAEPAGPDASPLAYVIYTSGSTGQPKGVMVAHRGLANLAAMQARHFAVHAGSRVLQFASFSFDACVFEIVMALCQGAALVVPPAGMVLAGGALREAIAEGGVTHATLPPAVLAALPDEVTFPSVRTLVVAGEAPGERLVRRWAGGRLFVNAYGPTEATIWATWQICRPEQAGAPPIGRPIDNFVIYLLDTRGRPVPLGATGEIHIGGVGVASGYLNRAALTAQRFRDDPFRPGGRVYASGDLGRWRADGTLDYLGRNDFQVKIRGFRVELEEIGAQLVRAGADHAAVIARDDGRGETRLVAYCTGTPVDAETLRERLRASLPAHMVPAAFVWLDALPLTHNGKLDRRALPQPDAQAYASRAYEAPKGATEATLASLWQVLLDVERVGRHDHFFELGGHSLLAVRLISQVRQRLGVELALGELFAHPVLAELAEAVTRAARSSLPAIEPADRTGVLPLSFAQQRLWFLAQVEGASAAYHIPGALRLRGRLDADALRRALDGIVARHEVLRTRFERVRGQAVQRIDEAGIGFALSLHDLSDRFDTSAGALDAALAERIEAEALAPFDLERGPLIRGQLVRLGPDDHALLLTMHHIAADGWSMGVLTRELAALYEACRRDAPAPLPPLPVQYADYAAWQRRLLDGDALREQAAYWRDALANAPALLSLPTDRPRPARQDFAGAAVPVRLDAGLSAALKALGLRHGATLYMTLLAGWAVVLARLSGQDEVVIGSPAANRMRAETEDLIGFFVNTLALPVDLSGEPGVAALLRRVRARTLEAQARQDLPFEQVVELVKPVRSLSHSPLFQVMFAWQNVEMPALALPGLTLEPLAPVRASAKFDLTLELGEADGEIVGALEYATALFDRATVERHVGYLERVLREMTAREQAPAAALPMLGDAERQRLLVMHNRTEAAYPFVPTVAALVEAQVRRTPDAPAVAQRSPDDGAERVLSYAQLDEQANALAHHLIARGVRPGDRVAICVQRCPEMVVGLLAILKAGAGYVPLDPSYPPGRLAYMLADSAPAALLMQHATAPLLDPGAVPAVLLDAADGWPRAPRDRPEVAGHGPAQLAYLIYTSGSTGQPKGVAMAHGPLVNLLQWQAGAVAAGRTLQFAALGFDVAFQEIFGTLAAGAALELIDADLRLDFARLWAHIRARGVARLYLPYIALQALAEAATAEGAGHAPALREVITAGEQLRITPQLTAFFTRHPGCRLHNHYGPTESHVCVAHTLPDDPATWPALPPIGRPVGNARIYLLDAHGEPVPEGVAGEIHVGGAQVALGYRNRDDLSRARFVHDPFAGAPDARMYRTGDLGRWRADGMLDYLGRNDDQVKIRGFRVEPGEIAARLARCAGVREAAVVALEAGTVPGDRRLVAYWSESGSGEARGAEDLRAELQASLPEHMVPSAYVRLAALPLTPNGKLDHRALPAPDASAYASRAYEAPQGETEQALAALWAEVLKLETIGRHDSFFALGGHSLLAMTLLDRIEKAFAVRLSISTLFAYPELSRQARQIDFPLAVASPVAMTLPLKVRDEGGPLLFCVHPASGLSWSYVGLGRYPQGRFQVYGLQAAGIEPDTRPAESVEAMSRDYIEAMRRVQPRGPYRVLGWSMGGLVAFEIACQLQAMGERVDFLGMLDSYILYTTEAVPVDDQYTLANVLRTAGHPMETIEAGHPLTVQEVAAIVRRDGQMFADLTEAHIHGLVAVRRNNLRISQRYLPGSVFKGTLTHFTATEEAVRMEPPQTHWRAHVDGEIRSTPIACSHDDIGTPRYLAEVAVWLDEMLGEAPDDRTPEGQMARGRAPEGR